MASLLLALLVVAAAPTRAGAEEDDPSRVPFRAHLDPADLGPGDSGHVVITAQLENGNGRYVYAEGETPVRWRPLEVAGVTYGLPTEPPGDEAGWSWHEVHDALGDVSWTDPHEHGDPNYPELPPNQVWMGEQFVLRIPVTVAEDVPAGTEIGVVLDYSACEADTGMCFMGQRGQEALVPIGRRGAAAGAPAGVPKDGEGGAAGSPKITGSPAVTGPSARVSIAVREAEGGGQEAVITFAPAFGYHLYLPGNESGSIPVAVEPQPTEGLTWGDVSIPEGDELREPLDVVVPFERVDARQAVILVTWQGCTDGGLCEPPQEDRVLGLTWGRDPLAGAPMVPPASDEGAPPKDAPAPEPAIEVAEGEKVLVLPGETIPFPVVLGDDPSQPRVDGDWRVVEAASGANEAGAVETRWQRKWREAWWLVLGTVFLFGLGLAFTPCVLPIIPLTISVIGGSAGKGDVSRGRLGLLLTIYVLGLSLTYGAAGAASGALGEAVDIEAAFREPAFLWAFAAIFFVLAVGMLGVFELQPPAFLEKVRGNVQRKSGGIVKSFLLGCLAAVVASPCTGPFVVGLLAFTVSTQSTLIGFLVFFTLGLGMGAVFFAAGSLNMLARPGPWMVWVRYGLGILLVGVALYYVADPGLISPAALFIIGFVAAAGVGVAVTLHLIHKEHERAGTARFRGAVVAVLLVVTTGVVAMLTRRVEGPDAIKLESVAQLRELVAEADAADRPVVVDVWATWCKYCKEYDKVIERDPYLRRAFGNAVFLKIDESTQKHPDLRRAVGMGRGQPLIVFFDEEGRIRRGLDVKGWMGKESLEGLRERIDFAAGVETETTTSAHGP